MNRTERILFEQEREEEYIYSVTYYDDDKEQYANVFDDFEQAVEFVAKLIGWRHINILRFRRDEL